MRNLRASDALCIGVGINFSFCKTRSVLTCTSSGALSISLPPSPSCPSPCSHPDFPVKSLMGVLYLKVECFEGRPGVLMFGMLCVLTATGTVLLLATHIETPVSTTQATIGAILGMTLSFEDPDCVVWHEGSSRFPYFRGISAIVVSWVIAPVVCGGVSHVLFFLLRRLVLSEGSHPLVGIFTNDPFSKALKALPLLVCCTIFMSGKFAHTVCLQVLYRCMNGSTGGDCTQALPKPHAAELQRVAFASARYM